MSAAASPILLEAVGVEDERPDLLLDPGESGGRSGSRAG